MFKKVFLMATLVFMVACADMRGGSTADASMSCCHCKMCAGDAKEKSSTEHKQCLKRAREPLAKKN